MVCPRATQGPGERLNAREVSMFDWITGRKQAELEPEVTHELVARVATGRVRPSVTLYRLSKHPSSPPSWVGWSPKGQAWRRAVGGSAGWP